MFQSTKVGKDHGEIENEKKNINLICSFKQLWKFLKVNLSAEYIYEKKNKNDLIITYIQHLFLNQQLEIWVIKKSFFLFFAKN